MSGDSAKQPIQLLISGRFCVLECQRVRKSAIEVRTDARRVSRLRKKASESIRKRIGQWLHCLPPVAAFSIASSAELCCQHQQPRPSVRSLEPVAQRLSHAIELRLDIGSCQL